MAVRTPGGAGGGGVPVEEPVLFILLDFSDVLHRTEPEGWYLRGFDLQKKSLRHYYQKVSRGLLDLSPAKKKASAAANQGIAGWYRLKWRAGEDRHPFNVQGKTWYEDVETKKGIAAAALEAAGAEIDFSSFDVDGDHLVESQELHVALVIAGLEAYGGTRPFVWPRHSHLDIAFGNITVEYFSFLGELQRSSTVAEARFSPLGTACHEIGHGLGLPDLYDYDSNNDDDNEKSAGVGCWCLMGSGNHNGNGESPAYPCAYLRAREGWIPLGVVDQSLWGQILRPVEEMEPPAYKLPTSKPEEYFLVENRQLLDYDEKLPKGGLLIWHIDESVDELSSHPNDDEIHKRVDLECVTQGWADHIRDADCLDQNMWCCNCAWPDAKKITFFPHSMPSTRTYSGELALVAVRKMEPQADGSIQADLLVGDDVPLGTLDGAFVVTPIDGSADAFRVLLNAKEPQEGLLIESWRFTLCYPGIFEVPRIEPGEDENGLRGTGTTTFGDGWLTHEFQLADGLSLESKFLDHFELLKVFFPPAFGVRGSCLGLSAPYGESGPAAEVRTRDAVFEYSTKWIVKNNCIDTKLSLALDDGSPPDGYRVGIGQKLTVTVFADVPSNEDTIRGWVYGVKHDEEFLKLDAVTIQGTVAGNIFKSGFDATDVDVEFCLDGKCDGRRPGGGFLSMIVLSSAEEVYLPTGPKMSLARATYTWIKDPGCQGTSLEITNRLAANTIPCASPCAMIILLDGMSKIPMAARLVLTGARFFRGDSNADGTVDIADPIFTLEHLFSGGPAPSCLKAADVDNLGSLDLTDAILVLQYLFQAGPAPSPPFPDCGCDPTADSLDCGAYPPSCAEIEPPRQG